MSPRRYRPNFKARPLFEGLPRTKIRMPGFLSSSGVVLAGLGLFLLSGHPPPGELSRSAAEAVRVAGWMSLTAGAAMLLAALAALKRGTARALAAASGSPDAWKLDHGWTPGKVRDHAIAATCEALFWTLASFGVAAGGFAAARAGSDAGRLMFQAGSFVLACVAATGVYVSFPALRRGVLFGESRLTWGGGDPLLTGDEWTGEIKVAESVSAPYAHLQFVKEQKIETSDSVEYRRREHDRVEVACRVERGPDGSKVLRLTARIPQDAPSTELSRDPARYWELRVADDASGWSTTFLVPVYS